MWSRSLLLRAIRSSRRGTECTDLFPSLGSAPVKAKNVQKITIATIVSARYYSRDMAPKDQKVFQLLSKQEPVQLERHAELAWANKDWAKSAQLWREASDSWERVMPKLTALHRLATLHARRGLYEACEGVYREALQRIDELSARPPAVETNPFGDEAPARLDYDAKLVAELRTVLLHELGRVYAVLGRAAEAHEALLEAARDWQSWTLLDPSKRGLTAAMSADVALFYEHRGNHREALQWHVQTLQRNNGQDPLPWDHAQVTSTLHGLVHRFNKPTRAERHAVFDTLEEVQHAIREHIAHRGEEHVTLVPLYLYEAVVARQLDLNSQALHALTRAAEISFKCRGEAHVSHATVLHHLGLHYYATDQLDAAVQHSVIALQIKQAALGRDHIHAALIQWDLGVYKHRTHGHSESHYLLDNALQILRAHYTRDHPVLTLMQQALAELERAAPKRPEVNAALYNAVKESMDGDATRGLGRDLKDVLFNKTGSGAASAESPRAQADAVQHLLDKYLRDKQ